MPRHDQQPGAAFLAGLRGTKAPYAWPVSIDVPVEPLSTGWAFADLSSWRKVAVSGGDAFEWLNDLVSADLSGLGPNRARRSLLLSPTGRIRAEFTVAAPDGPLMLVQDPDQPRSMMDRSEE